MKTPCCKCVFILALSLAGCASPPIIPYTPIVYDSAKLAEDVLACRAATGDYRTRFNALSIGESAGSAAAAALPQAAIDPLSVGLSALGAAGAATINGLGLSSHDKTTAFLRCVDRLTLWDRSAVFADPRE